MKFKSERQERELQAMFTLEEKTTPKYSIKQAYEQAAMAYRGRTGKEHRVVFPAGSYGTFNDAKVLNSLQFHLYVEDLLNYLHDQDNRY